VSKEQVGFRLEPEQVERLDVLAEVLTKRAAGVPVNRSMAARTALERGLAVMEQEVGITPKKGSKSASKPK
jgi:predicted DNA-binding protein